MLHVYVATIQLPTNSKSENMLSILGLLVYLESASTKLSWTEFQHTYYSNISNINIYNAKVKKLKTLRFQLIAEIIKVTN